MKKNAIVENENFDQRLVIRMNKDCLDTFKVKSGILGKPYQIVLREIITAFNDGRVRIIPTSSQKESLKFYKG